MMDKLIYYYRVVHLQVGSTYIVALALIAFVVEIVIALKKEEKPGRSLVLQGILWLATLTPIGIIIAKVFLGGEPNNPLLFAIIPAAACVAYGVVSVYRYRAKTSILILAAILIILAAGQVSGFVLPPVSTDAYAREDEILEIEAAIDGDIIIAPFEIASRLKEYRDDLTIYIYDETVSEPRYMNSGPVGINMDADVMICPAEDTAENVQMYLYGYEYLLQTEHYTVMRIPKE